MNENLLNVILGFLVGGFLAIVIVFIIYYFKGNNIECSTKFKKCDENIDCCGGLVCNFFNKCAEPRNEFLKPYHIGCKHRHHKEGSKHSHYNNDCYHRDHETIY